MHGCNPRRYPEINLILSSLSETFLRKAKAKWGIHLTWQCQEIHGLVYKEYTLTLTQTIRVLKSHNTTRIIL